MVGTNFRHSFSRAEDYGAINLYGNNSLLNYSVAARQDTLFGFSSKPLTIPVTVSRSQVDKAESVQIQLSTKIITLEVRMLILIKVIKI